MSRHRLRSHQVGGGIVGMEGSYYFGYNPYPIYRSPASVVEFSSCLDELHSGPPYRSGGPLSITKVRYRYTDSPVTRCYDNTIPSPEYIGVMYSALPGNSFPAKSSFSALGAEAWNRAIPVSPILSLGVAIGELKDAPRMLSQTFSFFQKLSRQGVKFTKTGKTVGDLKRNGWKPTNIGDDYLNLQFGWIPFLRDLYGLLTFQEKLAKKLQQLKRDNGRSVRRRRTMRKENDKALITSGSAAFSSLSPALNTSFYVSGAGQPYTVTRIYKRNVWFSAKFSFWIPELEDPNADLTALKFQLLGLTLDPVVIYNLVPWTWLLDWFTNTGPIVENALAFARYHVVASYAYIMQSESTEYIREGTTLLYQRSRSDFGWSFSEKRFNASASSSISYKDREEANPYGFGVTDASLSAYQWSILVALGLTRFR